MPLARSCWVPPHTLPRLATAAERLLRCLIAAAQDPRIALSAVRASIERVVARSGHERSTTSTFVDGREFLLADMELFELVQSLQRDIARRNNSQSSLATLEAGKCTQSSDETIQGGGQLLTRRRQVWCLAPQGVQRKKLPTESTSSGNNEVARRGQGKENTCLPPLFPMRGSQEEFSSRVQEDEVYANSYGYALLAATFSSFAPNSSPMERRQYAEAATCRLAALEITAQLAIGNYDDKKIDRFRYIHSPLEEDMLHVVVAVGLGATVIAWAPCGLLHTLGTGAIVSRQVYQGSITEANEVFRTEWASQSFATLNERERATVLKELVDNAKLPLRSSPTKDFGGLQAFISFLENIPRLKCPLAKNQNVVQINDKSTSILLVGFHPLIGLPLTLLTSTSTTIVRAHSLAAAFNSLHATKANPSLLRRDTTKRMPSYNKNGHQSERRESTLAGASDITACAAVLDATFPRGFYLKDEEEYMMQLNGPDEADRRIQREFQSPRESVGDNGNLSPRTMSRTPRRGGWRIAAAPDLFHSHSENERSDVSRHLCSTTLSSFALPLPTNRSLSLRSGFTSAELPDTAEVEIVTYEGLYGVIQSSSSGCILLAPLADLVHLPDPLAAFLSAPANSINDTNSSPVVVVFCSAPAANSLKDAITTKVSFDISKAFTS